MPFQEVRESWVIIGANGRLWDSHGYPTKEAAEKTAAACITGAYQIRKAKRVTHIRPATTTTGKIVGEWVIED